MNILIVGANSLLGRNLVELLSKEHKIYATVRDCSSLKFQKNDNVSVIEMDLTDFSAEILPDKIDAVYYLAQSNRFREFPEGSLDMLSVNVVAPNIIAKWATESGVKSFVYASSGGVYTNPNKPVKEFFEIDANNKLGYYLNTKLSAEMLLKNYADIFDTFVILRPFFMYGPSQNRSMLIPRLVDNIKQGEAIQLHNKKGIHINPIYIDDAAMAVANITQLQGEYIVNIAGSEVVSLKEMSEIIGDIIEKKPIFKYVEGKNNDLVADIDVMESILWIPKIDLKDGIQLLVDSL